MKDLHWSRVGSRYCRILDVHGFLQWDASLLDGPSNVENTFEPLFGCFIGGNAHVNEEGLQTFGSFVETGRSRRRRFGTAVGLRIAAGSGGFVRAEAGAFDDGDDNKKEGPRRNNFGEDRG